MRATEAFKPAFATQEGQDSGDRADDGGAIRAKSGDAKIAAARACLDAQGRGALQLASQILLLIVLE